MRRFAQLPVTYTIACVLLIAGVTLALWDVWIPLLIAVAVFCLHCIRWKSERPQDTELERCRRRRTALLVSSIYFLVYAVFPLSLAWTRRGGAVRTDFHVGPVALAAVFVVVSGFELRAYRREGRKLRRLQGRCEQCGYDLQGLPEPRCPECGTPFTPRSTE